MAKKKETSPSEAAATPPAAQPADAAPAKEPKEPKKKREPKAKTAPAGPAAASPPAAPAPAARAETGTPAAPVAPGAPTKKKGKRPGFAPPRGKKLKNLLKTQQQQILKEGAMPIQRAVALLKKFKRAKFDETVEIHMWLGIDTTQSDQMVRGTVPLPHGIGKSVRVVVFCQGDNVAKAKEAGADEAGSDDLIKKIQDGWLDFDVALATQDLMGRVSRLGKVLGPRGLMPTPKAGTVITSDVGAAVREFKAGKVEYRTDKGGNVHAGVGKLSFDEDKLVANVTAFVDQVRLVKPAGVKGNYIKSVTLSATMSPGIPVSV
ncbi:MAG TPA: 50S ribosomal protein L1 [Gemmataceae bacterium]|nr:50S ribosomal protein L1 [Gemmataceae bacterium]